MASVNPTIAKDVALYFLEKTTDRYTPSMVGKTINQSKTILSAGYTKDEIINVIDYIVDKTEVKMYSIGYVSTCINDVLERIESERQQEELKILSQQVKEAEREFSDERSETSIDNDSQKRNRNKVRGFGFKSRVGEKFDFDMFTE